MTQQARTADICTRFSLLIKAFAAQRDEVSVVSAVSTAGVPTVRVRVAQQDKKRLLARSSQAARALRVLLDCIGEQQGVRYALEIDGILFDPPTLGVARKAPVVAAVDAWLPVEALPVH